MSTLTKRVFSSALLTSVFAALLCVSVAAAAYRYIYVQDFTSIYFIPCDKTNGACFIDYEGCKETDLLDCAYSAVVVKANHLRCTNDEGECLTEFCSNTPEQCIYVTANDDLDAIGIYGELLE